MSHDDDLDVQAWHVPPPAVLDRQALVQRALAPAEPRSTRSVWLLAAAVAVNAAVTASIVMVAMPHGAPTDEALNTRLGMVEAKLTAFETRLDVEVELQNRHLDVDRVAPTVIPEPQPVPVDSCDEVTCVLNNYAPACCERFKRAPISPQVPASIDRTMITEALKKVSPNAIACGKASQVHGKVKVHVVVDPAGSPSKVEVTESPDNVLSGCVEEAMSRLRFPATKTGGSFAYPFVF